ncbi:MAG: hypothetical protein IJC98_07745 [Clostridia bacterium]|nr:hypothetical protein [Clostridia bacterium]
MNRQQNNRRIPDPSRYDMYAAFRTKERGEAKQSRRDAPPSMYDVTMERRKQAQQRASAERSRQHADSIYHQYVVQKKTGAAVRKTPQPKQSVPADYGTRIQNDGDDNYRYGYHSSYRTADGRILDGFDKTGRPIYREDVQPENGGIVQRTSFVPDAARKLHPVRRIRVETLANTDVKPFPLRFVLVITFCTALIMGVLYTYMQLNEHTNNLSVLNYTLNELRADANALEAEVVRREDLLSIEQTAEEILGMVKSDILTKIYISIENEDKTEVVSRPKTEKEEIISVKIDLNTGKPITENTAENGTDKSDQHSSDS